MRYIMILSAIILGSFSFVFADPPSRRSLSDVNYSTYKSTTAESIVNGRSNVQLSSGMIRLDYVFVSSPGLNSLLILGDSCIGCLGNSTKPINGSGDLTSTYGEIPYRLETSTQGVVYTSTCNLCTSQWAMPKLRFGYERRK